MHHALGSLLACALAVSGAAAQEPTVPETVRFGVATDTAPFSSQGNAGKWSGYAVDLCQEIFNTYSKRLEAEQPGRKFQIEWLGVGAAERFDELKAGNIQALCGPTTVTINRMQDHAFSFFFFVSGASIMRNREFSPPFSDLLDLKASDRYLRVSVVGGTTTLGRVQALLGTAVETISLSSHSDAFDALRQKKVDFYFGDRTILQERLRTADAAKEFELSPGFLSYEPYAIAVRQANHRLLHAANSTLARMYRDGEIQSSLRRHLHDAEPSNLMKAMFELMRIPED